MKADNPTHVVLPFVDPGSTATAAFPVARAVAGMLEARLHVLAGTADLPAASALAQHHSPSPGEQGALSIESVSGDLAGATAGRLAELRQAMLILAFRLRDEGDASMAQPGDAVGLGMLENVGTPILVVPPEQDLRAWQLRRELLPQDGTPGCASALSQVAGLFSCAGIENLVLRVAGAWVDQPTEPGSLATPRYVDHPQYEWENWEQEFLERLRGISGCSALSGMRLMVANGDPATEILRVAREKDVDLIVLPWHGVLRSGRARMVRSVLRQARCPVLLMPERGERRRRAR